MFAPAAALFAAFPIISTCLGATFGKETSIESGEEYPKPSKTIN
jgi:hypothetical protein